MQLNNDAFIPIEEFAARHELTVEAVIKMIRAGFLGGRLFDDQWFIDITSNQTKEYLRSPNDQRYVNITSSQTQEQQRENEENPARQAWQDRKAPSENVPVTPSASITQVLRIIGIIAIGFGVILGIVMLDAFLQPVSFLFSTSEAELTFSEVAIAFGITLFYWILGVFCLGIAKVIELLNK